MKISDDTIGNRTRDLPACSAVPKPTAPPHVPQYSVYQTNLFPQILTIGYMVSFNLRPYFSLETTLAVMAANIFSLQPVVPLIT